MHGRAQLQTPCVVIVTLAVQFLLIHCAAGPVAAQTRPVDESDATASPSAIQAEQPLDDDSDQSDGDDLDALLDLADGDVGQLTRVKVVAPALQMEVTTVSRQKSTVGRSPAAVFVISSEMIRRSGARSVPEVLRLAPGVQVARLDANKWSISIRGFNGRFANKLLVQIDGRSVYTPLFAGVFWDVQDVLLEDVERIEVIRGPGATIWGANAVNGVINIITRKAADTQGVYVMGGAGTEQRGFGGARYGGTIGDNMAYRVYGKWSDRDRGFAPNDNAHDDWRQVRTGFRLDWNATCADTVTFQGDYYDGFSGQRNLLPAPTMPPAFVQVVDDDFHVSGGNVLGRWTHQLADDSDWTVQLYYDRTERSLNTTNFSEDRDTFDLDFQYRVPIGADHRVIMGAGYRLSEDSISNAQTLAFLPPQRSLSLFSYFIQDEVTLLDDLLYLTAGSKFQHNDFTGFEIQPTARLLWTPTERHSIWAAVSHAVRTPSRGDDDTVLTVLPQSIPPLPPPTFTVINGNRAFDSEELTAFEFGYREQPTKEFSWDLAVFLHEYRNLSGSTPGMPFGGAGFPLVGPSFLPLNISNTGDGFTYGFELASSLTLSPTWRVSGAYSFLRMDLDQDPSEGNSPRNQAYVMSSWDVSDDVELDVTARYVDELSGFPIDSYFASDVRLGWQLTPTMEFSLVARHLLDAEHPEYGFDSFTGNIATEVQREMYGMISVRY